SALRAIDSAVSPRLRSQEWFRAPPGSRMRLSSRTYSRGYAPSVVVLSKRPLPHRSLSTHAEATPRTGHKALIGDCKEGRRTSDILSVLWCSPHVGRALQARRSCCRDVCFGCRLEWREVWKQMEIDKDPSP